MNYEAVYRTAPATPGLLIICKVQGKCGEWTAHYLKITPKKRDISCRLPELWQESTGKALGKKWETITQVLEKWPVNNNIFWENKEKLPWTYQQITGKEIEKYQECNAIIRRNNKEHTKKIREKYQKNPGKEIEKYPETPL